MKKQTKSKSIEVVKKYFSEDDQESIAKMSLKIIDIICNVQISHAVMALGIAQEYLETKVDDVKPD